MLIMAVYLVPETSYEQLITALEPAMPRSSPIIGPLTNVIKGKLVANFYVDKWPDFSAVVCEYIWPRRSEVADISTYATSSEALLTVLVEGNLVTWGKRQEFQRIEAVHADYLLAHLKQPGLSTGLECVHERAVLCYPKPPKISDVSSSFSTSNNPGELQNLSQIVPDGFVFGKLRPHHAEMVASQWPRLHNWPNKVPYFKELIENYNSSAIYSTDNLDLPISYAIFYPCKKGFAYTDPKYKGQRLSLFHFLAMVGDAYPYITEVSHSGRIAFATNMGATVAGYSVKDLVTKPNIPVNSKL